ncbi:MAG: S8 family serine peptidase [Myxococcales bacterium]|nr:S8 family serine peptidase [Myxococcales bacterium]
MRLVLFAAVISSACAPPSITFFTAEPATIAPGNTSQLSWNTTGTTTCRLEPLGMDVGVAGALAVTPVATTDYTLTCDKAVATVRVKVVAAIASFTATPTTVNEGDLVTLRWESQSTGCRLTPPGEDVPASGQRAVRPSQDQTYTLTCGASSKTVTVSVAAVVTDPFFSAQWHLVNTGQAGGTRGQDLSVETVWSEFRGEGVRVSVVDDGVDLQHEDLQANASVADSHDYLGNATVDLAEHGTAVAGLVAARDLNGVGGRGVAPRVSLVSYNFLQDSTSANELDAMVRGLATNTISSNSWGDADDGTGQLTTSDALWLMGVEQGTRDGRAGKGLVYVFPSGNGANDRFPDDSNFDGQANSRYVLAIGGVGDDGKRAGYSEPGANVLAVAPSGDRATHYLTTTDITGAPGYNSGRTAGEPSNANYTQTFDGTSASTPVAAGVVALVLQANPSLTWRDVRRVLALSARRTDTRHPDWTMNGAGHAVNHDYGFGVLDAAAATRVAKTYDAGVPEVSFTSPLMQVGAMIPDVSPTGVSSPITVTGSGVRQVDFVEVTVTITHTNTGDLDVRLVHTGGVSSRLHPNHSCSPCSAIDAFTFSSVRHLDEPGDGTWTLEVRDAAAQDVGRLVSWKLALYGRP